MKKLDSFGPPSVALPYTWWQQVVFILLRGIIEPMESRWPKK